MQCPKCGSSMEPFDYQNITVDRCPNCGGLWFDQFEKDALKQLRGSEQVDSGDPEVGQKYNEVSKIECPICTTLMTRMVVPRQSHIWYENCPVCYGVFFDAGEFTDYKQETIVDIFKSLLKHDREQ